jgi:hypothetical protein
MAARVVFSSLGESRKIRHGFFNTGLLLCQFRRRNRRGSKKMSFKVQGFRVALQGAVFPPEVKVPCMALPLTRPLYLAPPTLKLIPSPLNLPSVTGTEAASDLSVPEKVWNVCLSVTSPWGSLHVPSTFAGTIQR